MTKTAIYALVTVLILGLGTQGVAQEQPPSTGAGILTRDGIGAQALALGNAFVAIADDSTAGYYNPASLASLTGTHVGGMYQSKFDPSSGASSQYLSATYHFPESEFAGGLTLVRRSDRDIPTDTGTFDATETLLLASAGYALSEALDLPWDGELALGASLKLFVSAGAGSASARGFGADLAARASAGFESWTLHLGYRTSDLGGSGLQWSGTRHEITETIPWGHHAGFGIDFPEWAIRVAGEVGLYPAEPELNSAHVGIEIGVFGLALRAGLSDGIPAFGVGILALPGLSIDAAVLLQDPQFLGGVSVVASTDFSF